MQVGLVSATGLAFQSIVVSTLFLLLAIGEGCSWRDLLFWYLLQMIDNVISGIDDVFLMLSSWHRTDNTKDVKERVALTVMVRAKSH